VTTPDSAAGSEFDRGAILESILTASRRAGHLGPVAASDQIAHAVAFADAAESAAGGPPTRAVDLGAGGGVPGLVLAVHSWPTARWTLIDSRARRASFLEEAVRRLRLTDRVDVIESRVEVIGREGSHRGRYDLVVARAFGVPAVVAECAAPLLRIGGDLVVSEPPGEAWRKRWPALRLGELGLEQVLHAPGPPAFMVARQQTECPSRFPRRPGIPAKRPLF
jgi:16S rRNA (guanine527-N7)-methyltransferase